MRFLFLLLFVGGSELAFAEMFFPQSISCNVGSKDTSHCEVLLDSDGYVIDTRTGSKVSSVSEDVGAMNMSNLYLYGRKYVLENQNFSSAKTRQWTSFDYKNGRLLLDRLYRFSLEISVSQGAVWYGYECRERSGASLVYGDKLSLSEASVELACGHEEVSKLELVKTEPSILGGLEVVVPVYTSRKRTGSANYLFLEYDQLDLHRMACHINCDVGSGGQLITYVGRISKTLWFNGQVQMDACKSRGRYKYRESLSFISLSGCVGGGGIEMSEYSPESGLVRAIFSGAEDGDGYKGVWISKAGDRKTYSFEMYPLTIY
ncbi:hypothetical protein [Ectopseudomonas khazarica]|uniref:hypothetical protein n=1 Tax=Ectopseudomonas khazarica TaxID=2502979 RepID=UPI003B95ADBC